MRRRRRNQHDHVGAAPGKDLARGTLEMTPAALILVIVIGLGAIVGAITGILLLVQAVL